MLKRIIEFATKGIWMLRLDSLYGWRKTVVRFVKIILLAIKENKRDKNPLRASALTYYSLLAIVPVLAMVFAVSKGFGLERMLEEQLTKNFQDQEETLNYLLNFAHTMLDSTKGGLIAGISIVLLLWSVMQVLGNVEQSFNDIWNVKKSRSFARKVSDYLSVVLIAPLFIIVSGSATVFASGYLSSIDDGYSWLGYVGPVLLTFIKFLPYLLIWILLTFIYMAMPNTKVKFSSAITGGIIAGTMYQFVQLFYIKFQIAISDYSTVYGSFAALPLLLMWLRLSWETVLFGAEVCFSHQNINKFEYIPGNDGLSHKYKKLLSLLIMHRIVQNFDSGKGGTTTVEISTHHFIPIRFVNNLVNELVEAKLLSEISNDDRKESYYQPAYATDKITLALIMQRIESIGTGDFTISDTKERKKIEASLKSFEDNMLSSNGNILVRDI